MWVKLMVLMCGWFQLPPRMIKVNLLLCLLFSWQQGLIEGAANPGLQLAVTSSGLDYSKCVCVYWQKCTYLCYHGVKLWGFVCYTVAEVGIPMLIDQLKTIVIPDLSGRFDTPIGHFDYDFTKFVAIFHIHIHILIVNWFFLFQHSIWIFCYFILFTDQWKYWTRAEGIRNISFNTCWLALQRRELVCMCMCVCIWVCVCVCAYRSVCVSVHVCYDNFLGHSISLHILTNNAHTYQINSFMFPCM